MRDPSSNKEVVKTSSLPGNSGKQFKNTQEEDFLAKISKLKRVKPNILILELEKNGY